VQGRGAGPAANPVDVIRRAGALLVRILLSRAGHASLELAQARTLAAQWLLMALAAAVLLLMALAGVSALLVIVLWSVAGWFTLALLALAYAAAGAVLTVALLRSVHDTPPLLSGTLDELRKDGEVLFGDLRGAGRARGEPTGQPGSTR
jgi:uncharacterized membrane protein YqjE